MKRSSAVTLILSGSLLAGCDPQPGGWDSGDSNVAYTNNTYHPGYGYWHAPYHNWYPYPYNYYSPGRGYYHGGGWSSVPEESAIRSSAPFMRGGGGGFEAGRSMSISRGGFGSFGHGGG